MGDIEETILRQDRRGIGRLRPSLPPDYCSQAARFLLNCPGPVLIATGFYILAAGAPETDGPPGALVLGDALKALGYPVGYVTDQYTAPLLQAEAGDNPVHLFPQTDEQESQAFATRLLTETQPTLLVAIERCGRCRDGHYRNMRGQEITAWTAKLDELFLAHPATVGIGDGGNEIGMGARYEEVKMVPTLVPDPCAVATTHLGIASVSNWGAYGLVAALSSLTGQPLLPDREEHRHLILGMAEHGAVDGVTGERDGSVDGFSLEENLQVLEALKELALDPQPGS